MTFPAEQTRLRLALRGNQEDTNRYYLAIEGLVPPETCFNPANVQRIIGSAQTGDGGARGGLATREA